MSTDSFEEFVLDPSIIDEYSMKPTPFGFNGLGEFVYERTYSRVKDDGLTETWPETVYRVVCGTYSMQKQHIVDPKVNTVWNEDQAQKSAREMFDRIFNLKFTPPGRGLWAMGTDITRKKRLYSALNNCGFVTTEFINTEKSKPFRFLMDMSMLGVGIGFDVKGAGKIPIKIPHQDSSSRLKQENIESKTAFDNYVAFVRDQLEMTEQNLQKRLDEVREKLVHENKSDDEIKSSLEYDWVAGTIRKDADMYRTELDYIRGRNPELFTPYVIEDTREGWVEGTGKLIESYLAGSREIMLDYSKIRPAGILLKTFGGLSSGPVPLLDLHIMIKRILEKNSPKAITITTIVDIMNLIGKAVVAGNVRRSSEISLGPHDDQEFLDIKNYSVNPERAAWGWSSNNSIYAPIGMDYKDVAERIRINGEPGILWMDNVKAYSRMDGKPDYKDEKASGTNPCSEQTLESYELCCLCEVFPTRHDSIEDFLRTLKFAYLYAKTVTLGNSHWPETNRVMMRNRRIGCSLTGVTQFVAKYGVNDLRKWLMCGYDEIQKWDKVYSDWFCVPRSIKTTSVKPSGCVTPDTIIDTSMGKCSFADIFNICGYQIGDFTNMHDVWLIPKRTLLVRNKYGDHEEVTGLYVNGATNIYNVNLEDGTVIKCTSDHKFLLKTGEWKEVKDLQSGDDIAEVF